MDIILQYIDVIWLPIAWFVVPKPHRRTAIGFLLGCMFLMRMQVEMMYSLKYPLGIFNFIDGLVIERALIFYMGMYIFYFGALHLSRDNDKSIVMASSIGMFFLAFALSSVLMIL